MYNNSKNSLIKYTYIFCGIPKGYLKLYNLLISPSLLVSLGMIYDTSYL